MFNLIVRATETLPVERTGEVIVDGFVMRASPVGRLFAVCADLSICWLSAVTRATKTDVATAPSHTMGRCRARPQADDAWA
jgi:hypothetical protein